MAVKSLIGLAPTYKSLRKPFVRNTLAYFVRVSEINKFCSKIS